MRILIADDHDLLRDALVAFLETEGGFETRTAASFDEARARIESDAPYNLVLLDLNMPGMRGLKGLTEAMQMRGGQRVALISGDAKRSVAEQALEAGAAGFVPKTLPAKSLISAVRFMAMGEQYIPAEFLTASEPDAPASALLKRLSHREKQVLNGLTKGKTNKEIARDLDVQEPTIKLHLKTLYRKLGAANRTQAALIAREEGLF